MGKIQKGCAGAYRYGFNGKEEDSSGEWGSKSHYDYGFRIYNPSIAKFLSVDPISLNFPYFSPYQFAGLDPIKYIDLDGLERAYIDPRSGYIIPASDFHQHTPPPGAIFLDPGPSKFQSDKSMEDLKLIGSFIPILDWGIDGKDAYDEYIEGNYFSSFLSGFSMLPGADIVIKPLKLILKNSKEIVEISQRTIKNSAGQDKVRNLVKNEDDLLKIAEDAAGGSLDNFIEIKPNWWEGTLPGGTKRRIEWQPGGEEVMKEGPHVKVMDWNPTAGKVRPDGSSKGSWETKEKYFIEGKENYE